MIYAGLAVASTADGDGDLLDCDPMTRAICAVHGKQMLGASKAERLRHLQHVGDLDGQPLTDQLVYDIVAEASFKSIVVRAGFQKYAWILDAKSYFQLKIPKTLESRVARPLSALGQIMLIATAACAKVHGTSMTYISEEHLASLEVFQQHLLSCKKLHFFETMFTTRCMVQNTHSEPIVLRRPGMLFTLKEWFDYTEQGKIPLVLPLRFDEALHEICVHGERFFGGYSCFFVHDGFAHNIQFVYAAIMGQSYFEHGVYVHKMLSQVCKNIAMRDSLGEMPSILKSLLHDIDPYVLLLCMGYHYSHEGVLIIPSSASMRLKSRDVYELFTPSEAGDVVVGLRQWFQRFILQPEIEERCAHLTMSNDQVRFNAVKEWAPEYLCRLPKISIEMILEIFDNMNAYVFEKNGFHIFSTPEERESFEADLRILWAWHPISVVALNAYTDICALDYELYSSYDGYRLVLPTKRMLLNADSLIFKHMMMQLWHPHYIWLQRLVVRMADDFRKGVNNQVVTISKERV